MLRLLIPFILLTGNDLLAEKMVLAVLDFEHRFTSAVIERKIVDGLRERLSRNDEFDMLETEEIRKMVKEFQLSHSGNCDDNECLYALGRFMAADALIVGDLRDEKEARFVRVRYLDCRKMKIVFAVFEGFDLTKTDLVIDRLYRRVVQEERWLDLNFSVSYDKDRYVYTSNEPLQPYYNRYSFWAVTMGIGFLSLSVSAYFLLQAR